MSVMRVYYTKLGGHYHCRVFTAKQSNFTFAKCGDVVFSEEEWDSVRRIMAGAEFVTESTNTPREGNYHEQSRPESR